MGSKSVSTTSARKTSSPSIEQKIKVLWTALQVAGKQQEKRGIDFGKALYELRESSQARRNWLEVIEKLGIPPASVDASILSSPIDVTDDVTSTG